MFWLDYSIWLCFILMNVAFITLLERKILSLKQSRLGPNKTSFLGLLQPVSDAVKLFSKLNLIPFNSINLIFIIAPILSIMLSLTMWSASKPFSTLIYSKFTSLVFLTLMSVSIYPIMLAGWNSYSKYAFMGAIRAIAQTISYEIVLALFIFILIYFQHSLNFMPFNKMSYNMNLFFYCPPLILMWIMILMAESNRTPFDFAEGESELVSGFNTEYSGVSFTLIFMAEYAMIYFMSALTTMMFFNSIISLKSSILTFTMIYIFIWVRATYPRFRYDLLMQITWKSILPIMLSLIVLQISILISPIGSKVH